MIRNFDGFENGLTPLCNEDKDGVGMNLFMLKGGSGYETEIFSEDRESALLLLSGEIELHYDGKTSSGSRGDCFSDSAVVLHFPLGTSVKVSFASDSEVLLVQKQNATKFDICFYDGSNIIKNTFGEGPLAATTRRTVTTVFDYNNAPYSKLVLGEVFNGAGIWSSYPPHSHPHPEVYFYRFHKPTGFGSCHIGENCYRINHNSVALIPGNLTHPQNAAPGYPMYYVWIIPHLENEPWLNTRIFDPVHEWLNKL